MEFIGIIPARYESSRFPGKPLAQIGDKPMIQWVVENSLKALNLVWVATDDERIFDEVKRFGGNVIMTGTEHKSGTDRIAEAAKKLEETLNFDVVINIQGDEPFIRKSQIELIKSCFETDTDIATLVKQITEREELFNPNRPKVVRDKNDFALYFSRSCIPFVQGEDEKNWLEINKFWVHIGMYAYKKDILQKITKLDYGLLEKTESLEQLRWLENGFRIKTKETKHQGTGVDTPEDLNRALQLLKNNFVS